MTCLSLRRSQEFSDLHLLDPLEKIFKIFPFHFRFSICNVHHFGKFPLNLRMLCKGVDITVKVGHCAYNMVKIVYHRLKIFKLLCSLFTPFLGGDMVFYVLYMHVCDSILSML